MGLRLNCGCGTSRLPGFVGIDRVPGPAVDVVLDLEREPLPYPDESVDEVACYEVLEHLGDGFVFALNELHRVLKSSGVLHGKVPRCEGKNKPGPNAFSDPTHKRVITLETFEYLDGYAREDPRRPARPEHADYGIRPWYRLSLKPGTYFRLRPRKTPHYDARLEREDEQP